MVNEEAVPSVAPVFSTKITAAPVLSVVNTIDPTPSVFESPLPTRPMSTPISSQETEPAETPTYVPTPTPIPSTQPESLAKPSSAISLPVITPTPTKSEAPVRQLYEPVEIPQFDLYNLTSSNVPITIENDMFILYVPSGILYPKNIESITLEIIDLIEKTATLSYYDNDFYTEKIKIEIILEGVSCASQSKVYISYTEFIYGQSSYFHAMIHELSHMLQARNSNIHSGVFVEGYAVIMEYLLNEKFDESNYFNSFFNYSFIISPDKLINETESYLSSLESENDKYNVGWRLFYYLNETYGKEIFTKMMQYIADTYKNDFVICSQIVSIIKECTTQSVFNDFSLWYQREKGRFDWIGLNISFDEDVVYHIRPVIPKKNYGVHKFTYKKKITLDFTVGFSILQFNKLTPLGISGDTFTSGRHALSFYDADNHLIQYLEIFQQHIYFDVPGATKLVITGDSSTIQIQIDYSKMVK